MYVHAKFSEDRLSRSNFTEVLRFSNHHRGQLQWLTLWQLQSTSHKSFLLYSYSHLTHIFLLVPIMSLYKPIFAAVIHFNTYQVDLWLQVTILNLWKLLLNYTVHTLLFPTAGSQRQTVKSSPAMGCTSTRTLDSYSDKNFTAISQTLCIFFLLKQNITLNIFFSDVISSKHILQVKFVWFTGIIHDFTLNTRNKKGKQCVSVA